MSRSSPTRKEAFAHSAQTFKGAGTRKQRKQTNSARFAKAFDNATEQQRFLMVVMCLDSGASFTIVPWRMISKNRRFLSPGEVYTVTWGDKTKSLVLCEGTIEFEFGGHHFEFEAWGVDECALPLLSMHQLLQAGAKSHLDAMPTGWT
jgi:hypothetical protein